MIDGSGGGALVGVDVGGTFTDAVVLHRGRLATAKVSSTPADQSLGVMAAVGAALARAGLRAGDVAAFSHGMTVGTNALLEGTTARTALVATEGFGDVLELRRQDRAHLYRLAEAHPPALVPHGHVLEARERTGPGGVLRPLTDASIARLVDALAAMDVEAVAVGLLFSFAHPGHEQRIAAAVRAALPHLHVSASHEVLPEIREYERISTTVVDACLTPVVGRYLERLAERARAGGLPAPEIMLSSGGTVPIEDAARHAAFTVLSGPAAGVIGAAWAAGRSGAGEVLTYDMGGTSCDVAHVRDGRPARRAGAVIAGHPVHLPMLDVETVSAGGGSLAWADSGGALRVGPRSAGARPGPAAYGRGGDRATVTDANVVLGRLPAHHIADAVRIDHGAAAAAVAALAGALGMAPHSCAEGILAVAIQEMARALRRVSVERGVDPREAALVALGGAGPLHACGVAEDLGMERVIAPGIAGTLCALGLVVAGGRRDYVQTVLADAGDRRLADAAGDLRARAERELPGASLGAAADCRYRGQTHTLTIPWDPAAAPSDLSRRFGEAHRARYGDSAPERHVEVVSVRLAAERQGSQPDLVERPASAPSDGPRVIPMDGATAYVPHGWRAHTDPAGNIVMERR